MFGVAVAALLAREAAASPPRHALHDALVVTDRTLQRGGVATVHVTVTGAVSWTESEPVDGADVTLTLAAKGTVKPKVLARATTGADGSAVLSFRVPKVELGAHRLVIATRSRDGAGRTERAVQVEDGALLHLRTDRGVYRPGQTVSWRVTALGKGEVRALAGERVEVVVRDPRGTAIWRGRRALPPTGMVAGALPLGDDLLTGGYSVSATVFETTTTGRFEVKEVALPAFEVTLSGDAAAARVRPGAALGGRVAARYSYGEPVRGTAVVRADGHGEIASGALDEQGQLAFTWKTPAKGGQAVLRVEVIDGAQRRERVDRVIDVGARPPLRVVLVPERPALVPGEAQWFTAITVRGDDELAPARVVVDGGAGQRVAVASTGAARVQLRAPARGPWKVSARASDRGETAHTMARVALRERGAPVLRAVEPVVAAGAPVVVTGRWRGARGPLVATLLRNGAPIASTVARVGRGGAIEARLAPPAGAFGLATVRVVDTGWTRPRRTDSDPTTGPEDEPGPGSDPDSDPDPDPDSDLEHEHEHVNVYLRPGELALSITGETRYRPGQKAQVTIAVRDAAGRPVAAALAASVVDERALALGAPGPDLVTALRELDAIDDAASLGLTFAALLAAPRSPAQGGALRAILEALPPEAITPDLVIPAEVRYRAEVLRIDRLREAIWPLLVAGGALGRSGYRTALTTYLERSKLAASDRATPWSVPTTWAYAVDIDPGLAFAKVAPVIAGERLEALAQALGDQDGARDLLRRRRTLGLRELVRRKVVAAAMTIDPWGQGLRVRRARERGIDLLSAGPDGAFDTGDDLRYRDVFHDLGVYGYGLYGVGAGGGGTGWGSIGAGRYGNIGHGSGTGSGIAQAALRARFDETVLWRAGVATGADGSATLDVDLSDSVTGWKVDVEALAPGAVGAATARLETFLPLHLDAELPARLATGDRYRVPIAIANHSGRERNLSVAAKVSGALRAEGVVGQMVRLADGAAGVVYVTAVAGAAGSGEVELFLRDEQSQLVDHVRRTIAVDPPGDVVRTVRAGRVEDGRARFAFTIPAGAAPGSLRGQLRLFRGAADQAQDGLEGMLQEPYGCFEQTSSTTYPNLLVLRLIEDAPRMRAIRERARDLVGRGYQRLISYEVSGGGFSWFGEAPANQVLTAYGIVEFADMAAVYPVDPELIARTRTWLLSKQRPDGSWAPDASWLHDWSQVQGAVSTTAYVAWALAESGARGPELERALAFLRAHRAALAEDPYIVALWAAAEGRLEAKGRTAALALLRSLATNDDSGGTSYHAGGKTIFYASGAAADVQVTALAVTALDRAGAAPEARAGLDWLWRARSPSYGWGTTQSTVLALRAAALAAPKPARAAGRLRVRLDGADAGAIDLASVNVPGLALAKLTPGAPALTVAGDVDGALDADLRISWRGRAAPRAVTAGLSVALDAPADAVVIGRTTTLTARVRNPGAEAIAMPTVVVPVPPGFRADAASLRSLRAVQGVSKVEDHGDSLAVYLLDLDPDEEVRLPYRLEATAAVDVLQRPAQAYAYYTPDVRGQSAPRRLRSRAP
ncbi:MAG TPA: MG2 domain-containing protein [Kofleriaceae bacterium]|nr:MG2 domain-containing protein [Kofleriaceae bacterium]